ncbi:MAG: DVU_1551 family NTP transferase [Negativicutes bacterium]
MQVRPKLSMVIPAAGLSSRMREFKPLLSLAGTTVIEYLIDSVQQAGISDIVVVAGYRAAELIPVLIRREVRYMVNERYRDGMYSSVQVGVQALPAETEAFFLLPADVPMVKSHSLRLLARDFAQYRGDVTYPVFQGQRGHPPLITARFIPLILMSNQPNGLKGLLEEHEDSSREVDLVDEGILADMDVPGDYEKIKDRIGSRGIPSQAECEAVFSRMKTPAEAIKHGLAVASAARAIAVALNQKGMRLNVEWIEKAGLLHDLAKGEKNHARVGGRTLKSLGYGPVAESVARHMDLDCFDAGDLNETAIVHLADKLIHREHCVSLEERFAPAFTKYPQGHSLAPLIASRYSMAKSILDEVERRLGNPVTTVIPLKRRQGEEIGDAGEN